MAFPLGEGRDGADEQNDEECDATGDAMKYKSW